MWSEECERCHVVLEVSHMDYDPVMGWICIDCKAATKPASISSITHREMTTNAGVNAGQVIEVMA